MAKSQPRIIINCNKIDDRESFHDVFAKAFGFPDFYGRNMDAWIDCLSDLDDPETVMTTAHAPLDSVLVLELRNVKAFKERCPGLYMDIVECAAFVNHSRMDVGEPAVLALSFDI